MVINDWYVSEIFLHLDLYKKSFVCLDSAEYSHRTSEPCCIGCPDREVIHDKYFNCLLMYGFFHCSMKQRTLERFCKESINHGTDYWYSDSIQTWFCSSAGSAKNSQGYIF